MLPGDRFSVADVEEFLALDLVIPSAERLPPSKTRLLCGRGLNGGFERSGRPRTWPNYCRSWRCHKCGPYRAAVAVEWIGQQCEVERVSALWNKSEKIGWVPCPNRGVLRLVADTPTSPCDKSEQVGLWTAAVPCPPDRPAAIGDRLRDRIRRLEGHHPEWIRIPCDAWTIIVSSRDLTVGNRGGRPAREPRRWIPVDVRTGLDYIEHVLASGAVAGRVETSAGWRRPKAKPSGLRWGAKGGAEIEVAYQMMVSLDVSCEDSIFAADPQSVWQRYKAVAESFLANPCCSDCGGTLSATVVDWVAGRPLCTQCASIDSGVALVLGAFPGSSIVQEHNRNAS